MANQPHKKGGRGKHQYTSNNPVCQSGMRTLREIADHFINATSGCTTFPIDLLENPRELKIALRFALAVTNTELHLIIHGTRRLSYIHIPSPKRPSKALLFLEKIRQHFEERGLLGKPEIVRKLAIHYAHLYTSKWLPIETHGKEKIVFAIDEDTLYKLYLELQQHTNAFQHVPDWILLLDPRYLFAIQMILNMNREQFTNLLEAHDEDETSSILHGKRWYTNQSFGRLLFRIGKANKIQQALQQLPEISWKQTLQNYRRYRNYNCGDGGKPTHIQKVVIERETSKIDNELEIATYEAIKHLEEELPNVKIYQRKPIYINGKLLIPDDTIEQDGRVTIFIECKGLRTRTRRNLIGELNDRTGIFKKGLPWVLVVAVIDSYTNNTRNLERAKKRLVQLDAVFTRHEFPKLLSYLRTALTDPDFPVKVPRIDLVPRSKLIS